MAGVTFKSRRPLIRLTLTWEEARVVRALASNVAKCKEAYAIIDAFDEVHFKFDPTSFSDLFVIEKLDDELCILTKEHSTCPVV